MKRCKITILKTTLDEELAKEYAAPGFTRCPMMREGQVFYADYAKPEGFCDEAWKAVYQYVSPCRTERASSTTATGSIGRAWRSAPATTVCGRSS